VTFHGRRKQPSAEVRTSEAPPPMKKSPSPATERPYPENSFTAYKLYTIRQLFQYVLITFKEIEICL